MEPLQSEKKRVRHKEARLSLGFLISDGERASASYATLRKRERERENINFYAKRRV